MDPDMNKYDLEHVCTGHSQMSPEEFQDIYYRAWDAFYTPEHVETLMRRALVSGMNPRRVMRVALWFYACHAIEKVHPLQGGRVRRKYRLDRRSTFPVESMFVFYSRYVWDMGGKVVQLIKLYRRFSESYARIMKDPARHEYTDLSLRPPEEEELDELEMFTATESGHSAVEKMRKQRAIRPAQAAAGVS
jgi:hypothetical protein